VVTPPCEHQTLHGSIASPVDATESELYQRFAHRIRAYGLRHLRSHAAADDLVQQVLLVVIEAQRAGKLREPEKLPSYVLGTCRLVAQGLTRTERRRERLREQFGFGDETTGGHAVLDLERLRQCLAELPPREQTVVALTYYADRDGDAIASELGMTVGNVRVVRHRAMAHLAECVTGEAA
jgi:RNA polymerase sigma-70 factor, ECF subfamily